MKTRQSMHPVQRLAHIGITVIIAMLCLMRLSIAAGAQTDARTIAWRAPQAGDILRLRVWREPELSGDFTVDESGIAVLPHLGGIHVDAMSPDSLRRFLIATYSPYLRDPSIELTVLRRVQVVGAVKNPGLYPVDATMTVEDVVALAGGVTPEGDRRKVRISHADTPGGSATSQSPLESAGLQSGDRIEVGERGWMSRNPGLVATIVSTTGVILLTLARR